MIIVSLKGKKVIFFILFSSVKTTIGNGTVSSLLYLATASSNDSGTYTCELKNSAMAELSLHILNGMNIKTLCDKNLVSIMPLYEKMKKYLKSGILEITKLGLKGKVCFFHNDKRVFRLMDSNKTS